MKVPKLPVEEDSGKGDFETGRPKKKVVALVSLLLIIVVLFGAGEWVGNTLVLPNFIGVGESLEFDLSARGDEYVPLDQIPSGLVSSLVAVEDKRFYEHDGIDWIRIAGALWANLKALRAVEGGSTITEQLVDNTILRSQEQGSPRKLQAMLLALRVEQAYSKDQILENYLNAVYYGPGSYGIGAASRNYFGKPPSELDPLQQLFLAGVVQGPAIYDPSSHCSAVRERLNAVIAARLDAQSISGAEAEDLKVAPLVHANGICRA
jgi:membrane peptidoglycan carboxypeptidase